jgi:hypothetical protein
VAEDSAAIAVDPVIHVNNGEVVDYWRPIPIDIAASGDDQAVRPRSGVVLRDGAREDRPLIQSPKNWLDEALSHYLESRVMFMAETRVHRIFF